jgi:hypothetical protein
MHYKNLQQSPIDRRLRRPSSYIRQYAIQSAKNTRLREGVTGDCFLWDKEGVALFLCCFCVVLNVSWQSAYCRTIRRRSATVAVQSAPRTRFCSGRNLTSTKNCSCESLAKVKSSGFSVCLPVVNASVEGARLQLRERGSRTKNFHRTQNFM